VITYEGALRNSVSVAFAKYRSTTSRKRVLWAFKAIRSIPVRFGFRVRSRFRFGFRFRSRFRFRFRVRSRFRFGFRFRSRLLEPGSMVRSMEMKRQGSRGSWFSRSSAFPLNPACMKIR